MARENIKRYQIKLKYPSTVLVGEYTEVYIFKQELYNSKHCKYRVGDLTVDI